MSGLVWLLSYLLKGFRTFRDWKFAVPKAEMKSVVRGHLHRLVGGANDVGAKKNRTRKNSEQSISHTDRVLTQEKERITLAQ